MKVPFYRAFEDRYRGSRGLINERQQIYVPFLERLKQLYPECCALDLGCGRGEWLEILVQEGFKPLGIDLDSGMLEACHTLGLPVEKAGALGKLKSLPDESQTLVSGFHIAEHIPFDDLKVLVAEAFRVLKPAGILILETPNAENLIVGTQNFYLDPTHERPIPHLLLSFLTEYTGFSRTKLMRLQEPKALAQGGAVDLMGVLGGASPDYAVIAQKAAPVELLEAFDEAFGKDYGLALNELAQRYDAQITSRSEQLSVQVTEMAQQLGTINVRLEQSEQVNQNLESSLDTLAARIATIETRSESEMQAISNHVGSVEARLVEKMRALSNRSARAETRLDEIDAKSDLLVQDRNTTQKTREVEEQREKLTASLNESLNNAHHWWLQATAYEARIEALLKSTSWKITAPLRTSVSGVRLVANSPVRAVKLIIRPILVPVMRFTVNRPTLKRRLTRILKSWPGLHSRLKTFARNTGVSPSVESPQWNGLLAPSDNGRVASSLVSDDHMKDLSPSARYVYKEIKKAMNSKGTE